MSDQIALIYCMYSNLGRKSPSRPAQSEMTSTTNVEHDLYRI